MNFLMVFSCSLSSVTGRPWGLSGWAGLALILHFSAIFPIREFITAISENITGTAGWESSSDTSSRESTSSMEGDNEPFYADDTVYYMVSNNNGYSGDFELALIPESFLTDVMHETEDANGVIAENKDVEPEHFALLFEFSGDQRKIRHCMYYCSATRPSVSGQTKEDSTEVQTDTLSITVSPLPSGLVKVKTGTNTTDAVYNAWYDKSGLPFDYDMIVIDELSSFKSHKSKRFKSLVKVRLRVKRIVGLTGTPSSNGLMDLWAEFRLRRRRIPSCWRVHMGEELPRARALGLPVAA